MEGQQHDADAGVHRSSATQDYLRGQAEGAGDEQGDPYGPSSANPDQDEEDEDRQSQGDDGDMETQGATSQREYGAAGTNINRNVSAADSEARRASMRMRRREAGKQARARYRVEISQMEAELQALELALKDMKKMHLCVKSSSLQELLQMHPALMAELTDIQNQLSTAGAALRASVEARVSSSPELRELNSACVALYVRMSQLRQSAAKVAAAATFLNGSLLLTHPCLLGGGSGEISMASWMYAFLSLEGRNLAADVVRECSALLQSWRAFEGDVQQQLKQWKQSLQAEGLRSVTEDILMRLSQDSSGTGFRLAMPASSPGEGAPWQGAALRTPVELGEMPASLTACRNVLQSNEQFRCMALELLQTKLSVVEFSHFLLCRLSIETQARDLAENAAPSGPSHQHRIARTASGPSAAAAPGHPLPER